MKWIAAAIVVVAVLALIATGQAQPGHHKVSHYRGWQSPDNFCRLHVDSFHLRNCIKAQRVIYTVFPNHTQQDAMLVVSCETGDTYSRWATNRESRTAGLFQVHPGNVGRFVRWGNRHTVIARDLYNSWVNAKAALYLSKGGTDWHEWAGICQP